MTKAILSQSDRQTIEKHRPNYVFKNFIAKFRYAPKSLPCGNYNIMHPFELLKVPEFICHRNSLSNVGLTGAYTVGIHPGCTKNATHGTHSPVEKNGKREEKKIGPPLFYYRPVTKDNREQEKANTFSSLVKWPVSTNLASLLSYCMSVSWHRSRTLSPLTPICRDTASNCYVHRTSYPTGLTLVSASVKSIRSCRLFISSKWRVLWGLPRL